jgi:type III secretion protein U
MSDDKTEEPTDHKLKEARKKGEVAKSHDLAVAVLMCGVVAVLQLMAESIDARLHRIMKLSLDFGTDGNLPLTDLYRRIGSMAAEALLIVAPPVAAAALFAAVGMAMQVGLELSTEAVKPSPEKINPMAGLKRIFSMLTMITLVQAVVKAVIFGAVLWTLITRLLPMLTGSAYHSVGAIGTISWAAIHRILVFAAVLFLVMGVLDYAIQRWQFMKNQRMSPDEVKREHKGQEGDPLIKSKRKEIARQDANSTPKRRAVASANAVVVNPTHFAVAIRYRPEEFGLPVIVAKGMDAQALKIRRFAQEQGVAIFSNPPLARALYRVPLNASVPEEHFEAVAAVLRWVDEVGRNER